MKLRRAEETEAYWTPEGDVVLARPMLDEQGKPRLDDWPQQRDRPTMLETIRGKRLSEAKVVVRHHRKTVARRWVDKEGNTLGWSYGAVVVERITRSSDEEKLAEYMRKLKEINEQIAAARQRLQSPDVTQADRDTFLALQAEALELQTEYLRFRELIDD